MEYLSIDAEQEDNIDLNLLCSNIESMNKFNQVAILKILKEEENVVLNENQYGIHVNLTELKNDVLKKIDSYVQYVNAQQQNLEQAEKQKELFKNTYFDKEV